MTCRTKWLLALLIAIVGIANMVRYSRRVPKRHYADFRVYYATGKRFVHHEDIYSRPDQAITPFKYSPLFAMCFAPLSLVPIFHASLIFWAINYAALLASVRLSYQLIKARAP